MIRIEKIYSKDGKIISEAESMRKKLEVTKNKSEKL